MPNASEDRRLSDEGEELELRAPDRWTPDARTSAAGTPGAGALDARGCWTFVPAGLADLTRRPAAELLGRSFVSLAPGFAGRLQGALDDWRRGVAATVSYEVTRADGARVWLESQGSPAQGGVVVVATREAPELTRLSAANAALTEALTSLAQGFAMYDADETLTLFNPGYSQLYGVPGQALETGMSLRDVLKVFQDAGCYQGRPLAEIHAEHAGALREQATTFIDRPHQDRLIAVVIKAVRHGGWAVMCEDVTEREREHDRIVLMAYHDALTQLANRDLLNKRFDAVLSQAPHGSGPVAVLCLDLDEFKRVNDTLGHVAGDALLRQVADRLRGSARFSDTVARTGGDEFVVLQVGETQPAGAVALARRLIDTLRLPFVVGGAQVNIGASIGIAFHPQDGATLDELVRNADVALYSAKAEGRSRYRFYDAAIGHRRRDRRRMEDDLRSAIGTPEIEMHYQPIVECNGGVLGFEALMRWTHPQRGPIPPGVFIPIAEASGLIVPLGLWALGAACEEAATWPDRMRVSVNLSPAQLLAGDLHTHVAHVLRQTGLLASRLELEVTEGLLITNTDQASASLWALRAVGVGLALDDFGTGYSSLSYLHRFPFTRLKIDRSFIAALGTSSGASSIVEAIFAMSRSLYLSVTAEGVETEEQLAALCRQGCDTLQGFLLGRPMAAGLIPAWLKGRPQTPAIRLGREAGD